MYDRPFYISEKVSNNAFSFEKRPNKKLFVPGLQEGGVDDVRTGDQVVFEDFDDEGILHTCHGLQTFIKTAMGSATAYIFDNHNHAFSFWCLERRKGTLMDGALLIHIDQHKDMRIPESFISASDAMDPEKVFHYTNTILNVGNFIPAAQHIGLVKEIVFLDSQYSLEEMKERLKYPPENGGVPKNNLILDIDLDFFAPDSDYIGNDLKLWIIKKLIPRASVITFATSPYFIEQERAIRWLRKIADLCPVTPQAAQPVQD